jgi:nucleotide-binding universal stress UspA family protein
LLIRKILVAVDGSNPAFNASTYAIELAKRFSSQLVALHVIYPMYSQFDTALSPKTEGLQKITTKKMEKGKRHLDKVKQKATENKVRIKTHTTIGDTIVKDIVEYAENQKADMIVIGSRGMTGLKNVLLGSVAHGVVTYSHCPVLVVK